jgi:hypothetical protein
VSSSSSDRERSCRAELFEESVAATPQPQSQALMRPRLPHAPPCPRTSGADYIDKYDRFFFQWWNFLIYDAETHDHWTIVYHTTKYSKAANYSDYAR